MDRRSALRVGAGGVAAWLAGCLGNRGGSGNGGSGGNDGPYGGGGGGAADSPATTLSGSPTIASPAFDDGGAIPTRYTCDGEDLSPELSIADVPADASSLALLVDDPDAPGGTFTHWLLWDVPASTSRIAEGVPSGETLDTLGGATQGTNDAGVVGYSGPCPPADDGPHRYRFRLHALGEPLDLEAGADRPTFDQALGAVARSGSVLRGTYDR
ncbi:MAG TPA: YbhB/YbcL family Raf kinase inhibitor-like protein [Halobacteriales archaeon]|nr:YbhB/YbcL family Raf kinase inhibitor-like protein [Halobacteriales archaeon]